MSRRFRVIRRTPDELILRSDRSGIQLYGNLSAITGIILGIIGIVAIPFSDSEFFIVLILIAILNGLATSTISDTTITFNRYLGKLLV